MESRVTPAGKTDDGESLERLISWFRDAETMTETARRASERARDYRDGHQLTEAEIAELKRRGQPPVVINRVARKIDWLLGLEAQNRTDPRAFPRTPQHEKDAEAASDAIKFVCDNNDWEKIKAAVFDNMLVEGFGGVEVAHEVKRGKVEIVIRHYPWDRLFYDPHSSRPDFLDARYLGAMVWRDVDDVRADYPDRADEIDSMLAETARGTTYDDKPRSSFGVSQDRGRILVVMMYWREKGVWRYCQFAGSVKITSGESPYVDEDGASVCPLILQASYVDRDNRRYGIVHGMFDVQDEINKRRSKALHLLSQRQTIGDKGAVDSVARVKRELAKPDGHVEVAAGMRFDLLSTTDMASGQMALLQEAKSEIDGMGANAALAGEGGSSQSGRAVLAKQQGGMIEIAPILDRLQSFSKRVYEHVWMRVRQYWTEERWIRVTDEEQNARFVGLNRPVTLMEQLREMPPEQAEQMAAQMGLVPGDPRLSMVVGIASPVAEIEVDIVIDEVPQALTLQGETFEALVQLAASGAVPIPPEIIVEVTPGLRRETKDKLLDAIQQREAAQAQAMQAQGPAMAAKAEAETSKLKADAIKSLAQAASEQARVSAPAF